MIINTNVSSLITQNSLRKVNLQMENTMTRLSTGKRINTASDDAAGLAISSRMTSQIKGKDIAARNANDGISMLQTAEGGLGTMETILQRMRELALSSKNGTMSTTDQSALNKEYGQLAKEIGDIQKNTKFNGIGLFDNSNATVTLQVGDQKADTLAVTSFDATTLATDLQDATKSDISDATKAGAALDLIDKAITDVSGARADYGANINRLNYRVDDLNTNKTNLTAARSRIEDADMAAEMSKLTRDKIVSQASMSMLSQSNQKSQGVLSILQG